MRIATGILAVVCMFGFGARQVDAAPIDLELVLAMDVSGSVDAADYALQVQGYESAFRSASLIDAILNGTIGSIAVTLVQWSDSPTQSIGWMLIDSAASANAFADAIAAMPRASSGGTGMTAALTFAAGLFDDNAYEGTRQVIDVSGDGAESQVCSFSAPVCAPLQAARDAFLATGGTINALWIDDRDFFGDDPEDTINALTYGTTNVIGGTGAFQDIVQDFGEFEGEIRNKLEREITPVPEPGLLALLGLAFAAAGRRMRRAA